MPKEDPPIVKVFKEYGKQKIHEMLLESINGFIDKKEAYETVVRSFKDKYGWPSELTALEKTSHGIPREVYINRLHWMTARLTSPDRITESVSNRPFIALAGKLSAAESAYNSRKQGVAGIYMAKAEELEEVAQTLVRELVFEPIDLTDARRRVLRAITARQGQPNFRAALVEAYGGLCAISACDVLPALEAAHIMPYMGDHTNVATNGILLRADIHTLFDLELIGIEPDSGVVRISRELFATSYADLDGKKIRYPNEASCAPSYDALQRRWRSFSGF